MSKGVKKAFFSSCIIDPIYIDRLKWKSYIYNFYWLCNGITTETLNVLNICLYHRILYNLLYYIQFHFSNGYNFVTINVLLQITLK